MLSFDFQKYVKVYEWTLDHDQLTSYEHWGGLGKGLVQVNWYMVLILSDV